MNWLWQGKSNVVFKTQGEQKKYKFKRSILLFLGIGLAALLLAAFFLLLSYDFDITNIIGSNSGEIVGENSGYVIKKVSGSENILMYTTDDEEDKVTYLAAVKFDMSEKEIKVYQLATDEKIFNLNGKKATASDCYRDSGELKLLEAAEKYMGIQFGKYIGCKEGSVEGITANFSTLKLNFEEDIVFTDGSDRISYSAGEHEIEDDKIVKILTYSSDIDASSVRGEMLLQMFKQYFNESSLENRNIIYSNIISQANSNISIVDFTEYKDYIVVLSSDKVKKDYILAENPEDFKE